MSIADIPIIDVDSHVVEPRDLWTSRMSARYGDAVPQVVWDEDGDEARWKVGDLLLTSETEYAQAGWTEHFPSHPPRIEDADPACYQATPRLRALDDSGIHAQVLYPNLIGFSSHAFLTELGPEGATDAVRAYNDFIHEFAATDRNRLIPIAMLPYWSIDDTVREIRRVRELGFTGVLMAALLSRLGEKNLSDPHWNPVLAELQDLGMSVNLHVGFNFRDRDTLDKLARIRTKAALAKRTNRLSFVKRQAASQNSVIEAIADLIIEGTFDRFPDLKVVSVESGFGYVPFVLDSLDWHWHTAAANYEYANRELPSTYWRRNFFATFWFESASLPLLEDFQDNVMFETDFPHETGVYPGRWAHSSTARETATKNLAGVVSDEVARKVLWDNAAKLYHVGVPANAG